MAIQKVKDNFKKNPKAVGSMGVLAVAAFAAVVGVLTGAIEPQIAQQHIMTLLNLMAFGG